eukprot:s1266_g9.t1
MCVRPQVAYASVIFSPSILDFRARSSATSSVCWKPTGTPGTAELHGTHGSSSDVNEVPFESGCEDLSKPRPSPEIPDQWMRRPASAEQSRRRGHRDAPSLVVRPSLPWSRGAGGYRNRLLPEEAPPRSARDCRSKSKEDCERRPTPATMAAETLLQQLQEALAAEKLSKAAEVQAVEREMQASRAHWHQTLGHARLESAEVRWRNELEQHEVFWSSELAAEQQRHKVIEAGLEAEVISLKFEAEDWKVKEGAEMACKDQAESSIVSLQLLCGEQKVQLHHLHAEVKAAADAENATSRLEMSLAEGERLRKEAFDLRVTLTALTDRCKRQEQALARLRNSSARSNLPRPPLAGRREGALRGLIPR